MDSSAETHSSSTPDGISIGDRVGVLSHTEEDTIYIYGYGIFTGPTELVFDDDSVLKTGCVELDSGPLIYGHEGFIMSEEELEELQNEYENLNLVDIQKERIEKAGLKIEPA